MKIVALLIAGLIAPSQAFTVISHGRCDSSTVVNQYRPTKWSPQDGASVSSPTYDPAANMATAFTPQTNRPAYEESPSLELNSGLGNPSAELLELWSNQVSVELAASQLYLSASIWFRSRQMKGMAAWMLEESGEERGHGLAILEFAMQRQYPVVLQSLNAPVNDWQTPAQVWQDILKAEQTNTQNLLRLAHKANECGEYGAMAFLNPFHVEQIEAEDKVGAILSQVVNSPSHEFLMELDLKLGQEAEEEEHEVQQESGVVKASVPADSSFGDLAHWAH